MQTSIVPWLSNSPFFAVHGITSTMNASGNSFLTYAESISTQLFAVDTYGSNYGKKCSTMLTHAGQHDVNVILPSLW